MKKLLLILSALILFSCDMGMDKSADEKKSDPIYSIEDENKLSELRAVEYNSAGNLPNLTALRCDVPTTVATGEELCLYLELENNGTAATGVTVSVYLSENSTISTNDIHLGDLTVGNMASGQKYSNTSLIPIPEIVDDYLVKGQYHIGYIIDKNNTIDEAREYDNILDKLEVQVITIGDLDIIQTVKEVDGLYEVTFTNTGNTNTKPFNYNFVLSENGIDVYNKVNPIYRAVDGVTDHKNILCPGLRPGQKFTTKHKLGDAFYAWDETNQVYVEFDVFKNYYTKDNLAKVSTMLNSSYDNNFVVTDVLTFSQTIVDNAGTVTATFENTSPLKSLDFSANYILKDENKSWEATNIIYNCIEQDNNLSVPCPVLNSGEKHSVELKLLDIYYKNTNGSSSIYDFSEEKTNIYITTYTYYLLSDRGTVSTGIIKEIKPNASYNNGILTNNTGTNFTFSYRVHLGKGYKHLSAQPPTASKVYDLNYYDIIVTNSKESTGLKQYSYYTETILPGGTFDFNNFKYVYVTDSSRGYIFFPQTTTLYSQVPNSTDIESTDTASNLIIEFKDGCKGSAYDVVMEYINH